MSKKRSPTPDESSFFVDGDCLTVVLFVAAVVVIATVMTGWRWLLIFCVPSLFAMLSWTYRKCLLCWAQGQYVRHGIDGILVTSDSPIWNDYIRENWIAVHGERLIVLNWSRRKVWKRTLAVRLFRCFCKQEDNYCPSVLLFQGLGNPLVFRFFLPFRDHKHGNKAALKSMESRMFAALALRESEWLKG